MTTRIRHKPKAAIHVGPAPTPPERQEPGKPWSASAWHLGLVAEAQKALAMRPKLDLRGSR